MPIPIWAVGLGLGALGAAKHFLYDKPRERAARRAQAEFTRVGWTGIPLASIDVPKADLFGSISVPAQLGLSFGQKLEAHEQAKKLRDAEIQYLKSKIPQKPEEPPPTTEPASTRPSPSPWRLMDTNFYATPPRWRLLDTNLYSTPPRWGMLLPYS